MNGKHAHTFGGTCERCKHYHPPKPNDRLGTCHESSPQMTYIAMPVKGALGQMSVGVQGSAGWPPVEADQSCSRFAMQLAGMDS